MTDQNDKEDIDLDQDTAPNPDGFFPNLQDDTACSVAVAVRVRPLIGRELSEGNRKECVFPVDDDYEKKKLQVAGKSFNFDSVFYNDSSQEAIFDKCTRNLVLGCFHGYNATILAYGQTGSGKTHTMGTGNCIGVPKEEIGIVPRVFKFIFDELEVRRAQSEFSQFKITVSFLELYNEEIHDLLDPASMKRDRITGKPGKEVQIKEQKNGNIWIKGIKEQVVSSQQECAQYLNQGINHRQTSTTLMNESSSRSHAVFSITIEQKIIKEVEVLEEESKKDGEPQTITEEISAKFHFVDLAGSERIKKTGATGKLLKEGISINKGLLCLGGVISALTDEKRAREHIPYRDSKLTRILQDSLGGNSRTTMIACVSPAEINYEETLGTIKYASRARNIKNKPIVNRDPNSMLIDSLRSQIQNLQFEVKEYQNVLNSNGLEKPNNVKERAFEMQKEQDMKRRQSIAAGERPNAAGAASNQEVKELKIKLSHQSKEIKELKQKLADQEVFMDKKDKALKEAEGERDSLQIKTEAMSQHMKANNLEFDMKSVEAKMNKDSGSKDGGSSIALSSSLIEQYKAKLQKCQKEIDLRIRDLQERDARYLELKTQNDRNDKLLKKHMNENQQLKKQLQGAANRTGNQSFIEGPTEVRSEKRDFQLMRAQRKEKTKTTIEEFNQKFLTDLQGQIDDMFQNVSTRKEKKHLELNTTSNEENDNTRDQTIDSLNQTKDTEAEEGKANDSEVVEKEKFLNSVRQYAINMGSDLKDLLKNEWAGEINNIEDEKKKAQKDHKEKLIMAKDDTKKTAAIEREHGMKMESLNSQVSKLENEKKKKEESVAKQVAMQEARIKALEMEIQKHKLKKEEVEKAKKYDENRFFQFKQTVAKDLGKEKKRINDKEKEMSKLKTDLKKVDQLAQQKIAQLRGMQKRAKEEREVKAKQEEKELMSQGIDLDLIKDWIQRNTEAMLKNQELKEYLEKQLDSKDKVETEMLEEGDRMTELLIQKEKLEMEKEELEDILEEDKDEGKLIEIEDNLKDIGLEISSITATLDGLEETLDFIQSKVNQVTEEINDFDLDSVQPLSFNALESIESAKATLKTFFQIVLELNVYKRDLEMKCIEQDENVIRFMASQKTLEARIQYMIENGGADGYASQIAKQDIINSMLSQVDGFVDNRDIGHLNLNPNEQTSLTKLSLSKIVTNLKNKLNEHENKNQQLSLKLDSALKEKQIYKSRFEVLKKEKENTQFMQEPRRPIKNPTPTYAETKAMSSFGATAASANKQKGVSFKDRQAQKKQLLPAKQVESLADRRNGRKGSFLGSQNDELGNEIDRLKGTAENLDRDRENKHNLLEEIKEEELPEVEFEEQSDFKTGQGYPAGSMIEPEQNVSNILGVSKGEENMSLGEDWVQEQLINIQIQIGAKLIDFFFLNSRLICLFEDFQVQEIDIHNKELIKSYNLQEIEGFEISEDVEEDKVIAFAVEKDVMLVSVACMTSVHLFQYVEEEDQSLTYVAQVEHANISSLVFVDYHLVMIQDEKSQPHITMYCWDPDSGESTAKAEIERERNGSQVLVQPGSECIYFAAGVMLSKIEVPTMNTIFKVETGHKDEIIDLAVTSQGQIITTSKDSDIRFSNVFNGHKVGQPLQEMECDQLATQGIHLLTRIGQGEAMLVWKLLQTGGVSEEPVGEVEFDSAVNQNSTKFKMKTGISIDKDGQDCEELIMMNLFEDRVNFNKLTRN